MNAKDTPQSNYISRKKSKILTLNEWLQVSNTILGDLSYKTAGSQYKQSGVFEVVKAEAEDTANGGGASTSTESEGASGNAAGEGQKSSLKVLTVHSEGAFTDIG